MALLVVMKGTSKYNSLQSILDLKSQLDHFYVRYHAFFRPDYSVYLEKVRLG